MIGGAGRWLAAIVASLIAHTVLVAMVALVYQPRPVQQQPQPDSRLDIQAYQLDRTSAQEQQPQNEETAAIAPESPLADPGAVPQFTLPPAAALPTKSLAAATAGPTELPASLPDPSDALAAATVRPTRLNTSLAMPATQSAARIAAEPVKAAARLAQRIQQVTPPKEALSTTSDRPPPAATITPAAQPALLNRTDGAPVTPTVPTPTLAPIAAQTPIKMTAALAFDGASDGEIDPLSLTAFQSFTRPGDIGAEADTLRDGLSALLAQVPCARLQVVFEPESATLRVQGHIPEDALRGPVLSVLQAKMGDDIGVSDDILILPRPQCGALTGIATVGLPQSTDQITNPLLVGEDTQARVLDFVQDDRLFFDLTAPDYDAYVYVDYFDADGNVLHLMPNDLVPPDLITAKSRFRVGARSETDAGLQIFIGPPYGQEIAVAFAASAPLYDENRPILEPAAPYLDWLRERVDAARAKDPDFKGEWVYFFITTAAQ